MILKRRSRSFLLFLLGGELFRQIGGVVDQLGEEHGPRRGQRAPRPPEVQRAGVAVADGFLAGGGSVYFVEGQGDFDQFLAGFGLLHALLSVPGGGPRQDVAVGFGIRLGNWLSLSTSRPMVK